MFIWLITDLIKTVFYPTFYDNSTFPLLRKNKVSTVFPSSNIICSGPIYLILINYLINFINYHIFFLLPKELFIR